jgi:hypothetical protein
MNAKPSRARLPDPRRDQLRAVRLSLLQLHKTLIDAERDAFERRSGPMSSGQFLQALIQEPYFEWLRPFSALIVTMDEALASREPMSEEEVRLFVARAQALVAMAEDEDGASRYSHLRDRDPDVLVAHVELIRRIADASPESET